MYEYEIAKLNVEEYSKCNNIWDMKKCPYTNYFKNQIISGDRIVYIYKINNEFIGEGALVVNIDDSDYFIPNKRIYLSRMIVKKEYRNQGIGSKLIDFLSNTAKEMGYSEIAIGVDKNNTVALNLYQKKGFTTIVREDKDEHGEFYKLLKELKLC
ncbi:MAG: GNAT family N-acetyltransferase [Acetobacter sp.]|nr:GNAT family N-acetyltransferase [Bacteroides sp.]MCM1341449.1 GNAT family N-acetyltransferase [Acetobacter sp.]MCM1433401.1 GNAT family N-acetyltransferase [Clostridiales bacterium]